MHEWFISDSNPQLSFIVVSPQIVKQCPPVGRMKNCGAIDQGAIVQMLVVFVQFEPTQVDVDSEVMAVRKIGDCSFRGFEGFEKKFVRVNKIPACSCTSQLLK
jgi:hypothetical protein